MIYKAIYCRKSNILARDLCRPENDKTMQAVAMAIGIAMHHKLCPHKSKVRGTVVMAKVG